VKIPDLEGEGTGYHVTYSWTGNEGDPLIRTVNGGSNILIDDVMNLTFSYPKSSRINIIMEINADDDDQPDISLDTAIQLRNF
jgi:hypothetical protein